MFICYRDALLQTICSAIEYCIGKVRELEYEYVILASDSLTDYEAKIDALNAIEHLRAVSVSDRITEEFLSKPSWFLESVQADASCAVLYSYDTGECILVTFYDKEADFFVVDYVDLESVPVGALLRDPLSSLSQCIVYKSELLGKYDKAIIIQGKDVNK